MPAHFVQASGFEAYRDRAVVLFVNGLIRMEEKS